MYSILSYIKFLSFHYYINIKILSPRPLAELFYLNFSLIFKHICKYLLFLLYIILYIYIYNTFK